MFRKSISRTVSLPINEEQSIINEFTIFLHSHFSRSHASTILRRVKDVKSQINCNLNLSNVVNDCSRPYNNVLDEISKDVQQLYFDLQAMVKDGKQTYDLADFKQINVLEYAERYITTSCYSQLFCSSMTDEEKVDLDIQKQIKNLNWISKYDLHSPIDLYLNDVPQLLFRAIKALLKIDRKNATQDKINCIVKCSKTIFQMLKLSVHNKRPISADDFFPTLVFVCIKANPPRIQSNINFIGRFSNDRKLTMGEEGYLFANLCSSISFIRGINAQAIDMNEELFDSLISGKIRRTNPEENFIWSTKPLPINTVRSGNILNQESMDWDEPLSLQSHAAFKNLLRDSYLAKREKDYDAESVQKQEDDYPIFQTDEDYLASKIDKHQAKQEQLLFQLECEHDYPSLSNDCQHFDELGTSSDFVSGQLSTTDESRTNCRRKSTLSDDSDEPLTYDNENFGLPTCSSLNSEMSLQCIDIAFQPTYETLETNSFKSSTFEKTFQAILELSKHFDETRQIITSNNKEIMIPQLNRFCFPIWKYFKRRRCNTL